MNDFERIIHNRLRFLCGTERNPPHIVQRLNEQSTLFLSDFNRSFLQFDSTEQKRNVEHLLQRYRNLHMLAKVVRTAGTASYQDERLISKIIDALRFLHAEIYNLSCVEHTNWWQWEIGFPLLIHDIALLLQSQLPEAFFDELLQVTHFFQPEPTHSGNNPTAIHPSGKPLREATGANRVDIIKVCLFRAALQKNTENLQACLQALPVVWKQKTYFPNQHGEERDGFYADGTFIQHGDIPYNGAYGNVLLGGLGEIMQALHGTNFEAQFSGTEELYQHIERAFIPFLYKGIFPDMFNGRSITRGESDHVVGHRITNSLLLLSQNTQKTVAPSINRILCAIKREISFDTVYPHLERELSPYFYFLAQELLENNHISVNPYDDQALFLPEGERFFYRSNRFALGIALHSCRIANYESMNGENTRGWFTADGAVYLYDRQDNYTDFWNNADWHHVSGTTEVCANMEGVNAIRGECTSPASGQPSFFTEDSTLKTKGVLCMDFHNWNDTLTSTKRWTFYRNGFLYEESNICSEQRTYTTIEHKIIFNRDCLSLDGQKMAATEQLVSGFYTQFSVDNRTYLIKTSKKVFIQIHQRGEKLFFTAWIEYACPQNECCAWQLTLSEE